VGISIEFSVTIITQFCFSYTLDGVTAMPRGLHARLCYAFLVLKNMLTDKRKAKFYSQLCKQNDAKLVLFCFIRVRN